MDQIKDNKNEGKSKSMTDFLFSNTSKDKQEKKSSTLMFGGDYSNKKQTENNTQKKEHKKIPLFADTNKTSNNSNNSNKTKPSFDTFVPNSKPFRVVNNENMKMLMELRGLIDLYNHIFEDEDRQKILFLIDKIKCST